VSINRQPDIEIPGRTPEEVTAQILEADRALMAEGLAKLGVKPETIQKLRDLEGLARDGGRFLSMSVQKTHEIYFLQLVKLFEEAERIRTEFLDKDDISPKDKAFWRRLYLDMVKESGKGYQNTFDGARALAEMMMSSMPGPSPVHPVNISSTPSLSPAPRRERPGFTEYPSS
jgi:hypothetical protein